MTNLRFHSSGISSENLISVPITPATRQCASLIPAALAGTATASVILTSGKVNCVNSAQPPCSAASSAGANDTEPAARRAARIDVFMPRMIRQPTDGGHGNADDGGHGNGGTEVTVTEATEVTATEGTEVTDQHGATEKQRNRDGTDQTGSSAATRCCPFVLRGSVSPC